MGEINMEIGTLVETTLEEAGRQGAEFPYTPASVLDLYGFSSEADKKVIEHAFETYARALQCLGPRGAFGFTVVDVNTSRHEGYTCRHLRVHLEDTVGGALIQFVSTVGHARKIVGNKNVVSREQHPESLAYIPLPKYEVEEDYCVAGWSEKSNYRPGMAGPGVYSQMSVHDPGRIFDLNLGIHSRVTVYKKGLQIHLYFLESEVNQATVTGTIQELKNWIPYCVKKRDNPVMWPVYVMLRKFQPRRETREVEERRDREASARSDPIALLKGKTF